MEVVRIILVIVLNSVGVAMLDRDGYRPNVGIILVNHKNQVFWAKRVREHAWQFPQGGIKFGERPVQAMFRELREEVGLLPEHVKILGRTKGWLKYDVPDRFIRRDSRGVYRGQKQIWFLLRMMGRDTDVCLRTTDHPEFDAWRWSQYWVSMESVIDFKREVYSKALQELSPLVFRHPQVPSVDKTRKRLSTGSDTGLILPETFDKT